MDTVTPTGFRMLDDRFKGGLKSGELICISSGSSFSAEQRPCTWLMMEAYRKHFENGGTIVMID